MAIFNASSGNSPANILPIAYLTILREKASIIAARYIKPVKVF